MESNDIKIVKKVVFFFAGVDPDTCKDWEADFVADCLGDILDSDCVRSKKILQFGKDDSLGGEMTDISTSNGKRNLWILTSDDGNEIKDEKIIANDFKQIKEYIESLSKKDIIVTGLTKLDHIFIK